ncbi:MAG: hypothetical protein M3198_02150 [Actinomycetota bacterium]|nr:hypothetical protein [Actinomycetota bacterium]
MTLLLIILIVLLAAAGGFIGDLLRLAGWLIFSLVILGALVGGAIYLAVRRFWSRIGSSSS